MFRMFISVPAFEALVLEKEEEHFDTPIPQAALKMWGSEVVDGQQPQHLSVWEVVTPYFVVYVVELLLSILQIHLTTSAPHAILSRDQLWGVLSILLSNLINFGITATLKHPSADSHTFCWGFEVRRGVQILRCLYQNCKYEVSLLHTGGTSNTSDTTTQQYSLAQQYARVGYRGACGGERHPWILNFLAAPQIWGVFSAHLNTSAPPNFTPQHLNTSASEHLNTSAPQHLSTSVPQYLAQHLSTSEN